MEYKDIKTADELESWYAEKEDILEGHVRDYAVPFGNVYHLDSPGYVSEERWCDTLPSDRGTLDLHGLAERCVDQRRSLNIRMSSAGSTAWRCRLSPMITPSAT